MKGFFYLAAIFALLCSSCKKEEVENTPIYGSEYYPLQIGKFVIYDVDSTVYTQLPKDTIYYKYRIKEKIADSFTDNEGKTAYRLERYIKLFDPIKSYDSLPWVMKEVWMINGDQQKIQVLENNIRYSKLIFPVQQNAGWDGNANNSLGQMLYNYEYIDQSQNINGLSMDKVLKVAQSTYTTQISHDIESERYASNVGLVSRQIEHLLSEVVVANVPVKDRISSGLIYTQTIRSYGYE
jgi:hypothetical protein